MALIVRKVRRARWVPNPADDPLRRQLAIDEFHRDADDTDGLSVYEISDDAERDLVIAAFACSTGRADTIDLLEVSREEVERFGEVTHTPGETPVMAANALHRSLAWPPEVLAAFAAALVAAQLVPMRHAKADVQACVARLNPDAVIGERAQAFVRGVRAKEPT